MQNDIYDKIIDSETGKFTEGNVQISLSIETDFQVVDNLDDVRANDHVFLIANSVETDDSGDAHGAALPNGRVAAIEAETLSIGKYSEVFLHEFGHNLLGNAFKQPDGSYDSHTASGNGLMGAKVNGQTSISFGVLKRMWIELGILTNQSKVTHYQDGNAKSDAQDFIDKYIDN